MHPAKRLIESTRWFALATTGAAGEPFVSYVPFAPVDGGFAIVVSALAAHTAHLLARPNVGVLIVGEETHDPFARPRLSIDALARQVSGTDRADAVWDALARRNGPTVEVLRTLSDFRLFLLEPLRGRLVLGFAAAEDLDAAVLAGLT